MSQKTKILILSVAIGFSILASGCTTTQPTNQKDGSGDMIGMANPASVYCEENGGTLELIFDNGESYGLCHFKNGSTCEEREFYRKECFPVSGTNTQNQYDTGANVCTLDAKKCPDGSFVSRHGPNCEFDQCPNTTTGTTTQENTNNINEDTGTITDIFEEHKEKPSYQDEGLTEDDIELMEEIIEKLK